MGRGVKAGLQGRLKRPLYVQAMLDRHGHARYYFRRENFPRVTLPGLPWTPEFMTAYQAAMAGAVEAKPVGISPSMPGSVAAAVAGYFASAAWMQLSETSRNM